MWENWFKMNLCTEKFKSLKPPLELAWGGLDGRVKKKKWRVIEKRMENLYFKKLFQQMPKIFAAVIKDKGGYFDESKI